MQASLILPYNMNSGWVQWRDEQSLFITGHIKPSQGLQPTATVWESTASEALDAGDRKDPGVPDLAE